MKVLNKTAFPLYCDGLLVDYYTIYNVDAIPEERDYIEIENHKGYVVSTNYDEETKSNIVYLEKHLDDWNNQICEICDAIYVKQFAEKN